MMRCAFITDLDTDLGAELARLHLEMQYRVFGTVSSRPKEEKDPAYDRLVKLKASAGEAFHTAPWNRHSPVSARNMLLQARSRFQNIDSFLLIGNPIPLGSALHTMEFRSLDEGVDCWIKGNLFMLREILRVLLEEGRGVLSLICLNHNRPELTLEEAVRQAFLGITQSLLRSCSESSVSVSAFESDTGSTRDFAAYVFHNLTEKGEKLGGKLLHHGKGFLANIAVGQKT